MNEVDMAADMDNGGQKDDEYMPEVTGEEHIVGEENTPEGESPLLKEEYEGQDVPPQRPSALRKIITAAGIIIVTIIVSMYLTHREKVKEAEQAGTAPPAKVNSVKAPASAPPAIPVMPKPETLQAPAAVPPMPEQTPAVVAPQPEQTPGAVMPKTEPAQAPGGVIPVIPKSEPVQAPGAVIPKLEPTQAPGAVIPKSESAKAPVTIPPKPEPAPAALKSQSPVAKTPAIAAKPQPGKVAQPPKAENASIAAAISQGVGEKAGPTKQAMTPSAVTPTVEEAISESVSKDTTPSTKPPTSVSANGATDLHARVDQMTAQIKSNQNKMDDLSLQLQNVNKALAGLNNSIASLEKKLNVPVTVQPTIKKMKKKKVKRAVMSNQINLEAKPQVEGEQPVQEKVILRNFVLKAIVPGRAWIGLPNRGTVSIAEGEKIPGVGIVKTIDEDQGEVTLGSGEVITYGPDDH